MIYLASPYQHADPDVMAQRFEKVVYIAGTLMQQGKIVYSPIAHNHPIAIRLELPRGWEYWEKFDREFVAASTEVIVAMMPGWKESKGVTAEIAIAKELGIPVTYLEVPE